MTQQTDKIWEAASNVDVLAYHLEDLSTHLSCIGMSGLSKNLQYIAEELLKSTKDIRGSLAEESTHSLEEAKKLAETIDKILSIK